MTIEVKRVQFVRFFETNKGDPLVKNTTKYLKKNGPPDKMITGILTFFLDLTFASGQGAKCSNTVPPEQKQDATGQNQDATGHNEDVTGQKQDPTGQKQDATGQKQYTTGQIEVQWRPVFVH